MVGRGVTVGRPLGLLLTRRSENATVTLCHTGTRDLAAHVRSADIVVAAAGVPGIITGDMVKPGAAVLDVGVSRVDGKIAGDVAHDVYDVAGWVSPNPGGVGPMTRAMLLSNIVSVAEQSLNASAPPDGPASPRTPPRRLPQTLGGTVYVLVVAMALVGLGIAAGRRLAHRLVWMGAGMLLAARSPGRCSASAPPGCFGCAAAGPTC